MCMSMVVSYALESPYSTCSVLQLGLQLAAEGQQLQAQTGGDVVGLPILVPNSAQALNKK